MLSYDSNSHETVSKIYHQLQVEHMPVWLNEGKETMNDLKNSLAEGVENAEIVCCFMTPDYQKSKFCQLELQYAHKRHKRIIPCMLATKVWKLSNWLGLITCGHECIDFHNCSELNIKSKVEELIDRTEEQHLASQYVLSQRADQPTYLFELIKYEYMRNSRIERFINPALSFPIEESYINLAIVRSEEQQEKEKKLREPQHNIAIMSTFEEIYGTKSPIDVKDIFQTCKAQTKKVFVFDRAGIGKSTFCRYVAYQWATGTHWPEYELVVLIPLRSLTEQKYPSDNNYTLIDILKKEYFSFSYSLSEKDEMLLLEQFHNSCILWLLDGYDEITSNLPLRLESLQKQLFDSSHHIVTSRPYINTLSYPVRMEITGFTDKNILKYVKQFFDQIGNELPSSVTEDNKLLLSFIKQNPRIWGVAHIPINLELICSIWSNTDWSKITTMTMTILYDKLTEWICRRYLEKQRGMPTKQINLLDTTEVYQYCHKELIFLETLAFQGMKSNAILLGPDLANKAKNETKCSFIDYPHLLNIGILKSSIKHGIGTRTEADKDHYFIHLSFQEYFAVQYLINSHKDSDPSRQKAIVEFIKRQKYNQRYELVFTFASGLLSASDATSCLNIFWNNILGEPVDVVGIRYMQLVISIIEETYNKSTLPRHTELLECIQQCIKSSFFNESNTYLPHLLQRLELAQYVVCHQTITNMLIDLLKSDDINVKIRVLSFISALRILNPPLVLIISLTKTLDDKNEKIREKACEALGNVGEKAATNEVINKLVNTALEDESENVRRSAFEALGNLGKKAATNEVTNKLVNAVGDESEDVRWSACHTLGKLGEKQRQMK